MTKHNWVAIEGREKVMKHGWSPMRRCINCGIVQKKESEHVWMRVVGYKWVPKAGRCKGKQ